MAELEGKDEAKVLAGRKGGEARKKSTTSEQRSEIGRAGALARWSGSPAHASNEGVLVIGNTEIRCAVLETGKRLISQESFLTALGRSRSPKAGTGSLWMGGVDNYPPFLAADNLKEFISDDLVESTTPIMYVPKTGGRAFGYDALLLPKVCEVYLKLHDCRKALPSQKHVVEAAYRLMRGLAHVGIIALVDEATGYQDARAKDELIKILEQYIAPELLPWTRKFPEEFFREIYRLHGWEYKPGTTKRTPQVGKLINKYIYEQLPPGVLDELRKLNPVTEKGWRRHKHFQLLSESTGNPHLDKQIASTMTLMRISDTKDEFDAHFDRAFAKIYQHRLRLVVEVPDEVVDDDKRLLAE